MHEQFKHTSYELDISFIDPNKEFLDSLFAHFKILNIFRKLLKKAQIHNQNFNKKFCLKKKNNELHFIISKFQNSKFSSKIKLIIIVVNQNILG